MPRSCTGDGRSSSARRCREEQPREAQSESERCVWLRRVRRACVACWRALHQQNWWGRRRARPRSNPYPNGRRPQPPQHPESPIHGPGHRAGASIAACRSHRERDTKGERDTATQAKVHLSTCGVMLGRGHPHAEKEPPALTVSGTAPAAGTYDHGFGR